MQLNKVSKKKLKLFKNKKCLLIKPNVNGSPAKLNKQSDIAANSKGKNFQNCPVRLMSCIFLLNLIILPAHKKEPALKKPCAYRYNNVNSVIF